MHENTIQQQKRNLYNLICLKFFYLIFKKKNGYGLRPCYFRTQGDNFTCRQKIETDLPHNGLNSNHVTSQGTNSPTLNIFFIIRISQFNIEVVNRDPHDDYRSQLPCYPRSNFYPSYPFLFYSQGGSLYHFLILYKDVSYTSFFILSPLTS